ncbi:hypothetical protein [Bacillus smithii]|uniref:hypothetical protein n=1 Tax=Bacillus smithii TaxID=1479 RepID=UPI003D26042C
MRNSLAFRVSSRSRASPGPLFPLILARFAVITISLSQYQKTTLFPLSVEIKEETGTSIIIRRWKE